LRGFREARCGDARWVLKTAHELWSELRLFQNASGVELVEAPSTNSFYNGGFDIAATLPRSTTVINGFETASLKGIFL
jgi:hypothetical protein